jgi:pilus assembly protein CpaB
MGRRTLLLIAALVVAALGTVLIFVYVNGADARAQADAQPVQVLVATQQVTPGTTASAASESGSFDLQTMPSSAVADGALSDITAISDQAALTTIYPGQQVLAQMFGNPQSASDLQVGKGKLAMSVSLGDPERVAGFVVPGSEVAVFATLPTTAGAGGQQSEETGVLLPSVEVIGVGASTLSTQTTTTDQGEQTTEEIPRAILTLEVDQLQAQKIINAQSGGSLYVALRGEDANVRVSKPIVTESLFR